MKYINIPTTVSSIGQSAFSSCNQLSAIYIPDSVVDIGDACFSSTAICGYNDSIVHTYATANNYSFWSMDGKNPQSIQIHSLPHNISCTSDGPDLTGLIVLANYGEYEIAVSDYKVDYIVTGSICTITVNYRSCTKQFNRIFSEPIIATGACGGEGDGSNLSWTLTSSGTLYISGSGEMESSCNGMFGSSIPWEEYKSVITAVVIGDNVTTISYGAFSCCELIEKVTLPESITSIGEYAFFLCPSLKSINLPTGLTSISGYCFFNCLSLEKIAIPESVVSIGECAFESCTALEHITIPASVTSVKAKAFSNCKALQSITVAPENLNYADIDGVLYTKDKSTLICCPSGTLLSTIVVPNSVTSIDPYAFYFCSSIAEITVPDSVTSIGEYAFYACSGARSINIPNGVTTIEQFVFSRCESLTDIIIPNGVTTICASAFNRCGSISEINIPASVASIADGAFSACRSLSDISVDVQNTNYASNNGVLYTKDMSTLVCFPAGITIAKFIVPEVVTTIGPAAFSGCSNISDVVFFDNVSTIGESAFSECTALTEISIPNSVKRIEDDVFFCCSSLKQVSIPSNILSIGSCAFYGCESLVSINIPAKVESVESLAFRYCSSLSAVRINGDSTILEMGAFADCPKLATIIFSGDAAPVKEISHVAFYGVEATAYYPANNSTWTSDILQDYGGDLTWLPYAEGTDYHTRFSLEAVPQSEFSLDITIANLSGRLNDIALIATYSTEGRMLEVIPYALSNNIAETVNLTRDNSDGRMGSIKIFILDAFSNPIPLAATEGIQARE